MRRRNFKIWFWLGLAVAAISLLLPTAAQASTNVVFNPGFEQGGCSDNTPVLCGWRSGSSMSQDTSNPHSGSASMHLECGAGGCYYDPDSGWGSAAADAAVCVAIGPGTHAASFWYRDAVGAQVSLAATFYAGTDCSTWELGQDSLDQPSPSAVGWQQVTGSLHGPTYTQSALFVISIGGCDASCSLSANFDDIDVDDAGDTTPTIASFSPTSGWFGTRAWIYGFDFLGATSVTFNGIPAQFTVGSDQFIDAYVPRGATTGRISVTTANGTGWSSSSFTLVPPPTISSFTPTGGPFGTVVDIRGANFTGAIWVQFNQHYADSFTVNSDAEIHATVPDGATTGPISVTTVSGTGWSSSSFTVPTPTISSFTPTSGPIGTSVDILGTNFTGATIVTFHSTKADFTVESDSEIRATVPTGATTGWISVATPGGSALSSSSFTVTGVAPAISSFTPTSGPVGTSVALLGANFTDATSVKFNGTNAAYTIDSDSEIHATVPSGATSGPISVTTPSGTGTSNDSFTVTVPPPTISLTARGYKVKGLEKADLSWSGPSGASFDLYRSGTKIATVQTTAYTDNINTRGSATYTYRVCEVGSTTCSNDATVSF
ncbi:MAG TPA: IPT/TIG domain-containing protein [Actinomycetota bacterium]|jgi:hypothetical protein|nr:IPT/TIG domain-containing protein [Actinomycetota bacterium]